VSCSFKTESVLDVLVLAKGHLQIAERETAIETVIDRARDTLIDQETFIHDGLERYFLRWFYWYGSLIFGAVVLFDQAALARTCCPDSSLRQC